MTVIKKLHEIAEYLGATVVGDGDIEIHDIRGIDEAGEGDLTFIANPKYRKKLASTGASAVIVGHDMGTSDKNLLVVDDPYASMARALALLYPEEKPFSGVSEGAWIESGAKLAEWAVVYPGVYIGKNVRIGKGTILYPGVAIGNDSIIGEDSVLHPNVTLYRKCRIGSRVILHAGVVVGSDGFGFANPGKDNLKVSQVGFAQIDDDVEVGSNSTIDRGTLGKTWIQRGVKIDNLVQIGHNVVVGEDSIIVAQVGISGSTKLGKSVILGGQAGLVGHISIGDNVMVAAKSGVHKDVAPNQIVSGVPNMPHNKMLRIQASIPKLPEMRKTMSSLLKKIGELEREIEKIKDSQ
ncbi:MAG: UDP-3-O-(3-hydroxymyristoyl)glucosamine N-acyltransferase [Deltaproteobacteria bacterium]|nr:UDP-3-O-(3-hydroxymyristoyl)glucosamine N-acyltransferase [Deltaproteobacteria bacterium]